MNEQIGSTISSTNRGQGWEGRSRNGKEARDSKTGRFMQVGQGFDAKAYGEKYYRENKAKCLAQQADYYQRNKERRQQYAKEYRERLAATEAGRKKLKEWRQKSKNKPEQKVKEKAWRQLPQVKARNRYTKSLRLATADGKAIRSRINHRYNTSERGRTLIREWLKSHRHLPKYRAMARAAHNRRRQRQNALDCGDFQIAARKILSRKFVKCFYCGKRVSTKRVHLDHVNPLGRVGAHAAFNTVPACPKCNMSKGAKHPNDFIQEGQRLLVF